MTNEQIKNYFHQNRCYKFDGTWDEFQQYIQGHGFSHSTLRIMDTIYFDCLQEDLTHEHIDDRITEIL